MTHYLKNPVTGYVPIETDDKSSRTTSILLCVVVVCLAFFLGAVAQATSPWGATDSTAQAAFLAGDSAARSDYAELVNNCYDKTRNQDADALYSCIAGAN